LRSEIGFRVRSSIGDPEQIPPFRGGDVKAGIVDFRFRIDAEDKDGVIVYSLPFKHAINIIPEAV
jgi:hypothetical protein